MKFLLRATGTLLLAVAVVFAVGDIARSIADEATRLVTIDEALRSLGAAVGAGAREPGSASAVGDILAAIAQWSMSLTCGAAGLALIVLGRRPRRGDRPLRR